MRSQKITVLESREGPSSLDAQNTYAYWPPPNSPDERNVRSLIKKCSEPNIKTWVHLPGRLRGIYDSLAEAEEALELICGQSVTESEADRLAGVGEAAATENSSEFVEPSVLVKNVSAKPLTLNCSVSQSESLSMKVQPPAVRHKLHATKSAHCAGNLAVQQSTSERKVSEKPSKVNYSASAAQSDSVSMKTQPSCVKRKLHTALSAHHASGKSVSAKSVKNTSSAKAISGTTAEKSVSEKPVKSTPSQRELKHNKTLAVTIPSQICGASSTISVLQPAVQSNLAELAFGPNVSTNSIPVDSQSHVSVSTTTDKLGKNQNMTDARQKLINLCAGTVNISGAAPTVIGRHLASRDPSETSDGGSYIVDALDIINCNITAYMVSLLEKLYFCVKTVEI